MEKTITVIRGDGIGPEIVNQAIRVLDRIAEKFGHTFHYQDILAGGCAIDACGKPFPDDTEEKCKACDAVLLGAVVVSGWAYVETYVLAEALGIIAMETVAFYGFAVFCGQLTGNILVLPLVYLLLRSVHNRILR